MTPEQRIVESAHQLASSLPTATVQAVAAALLSGSTAGLRTDIAKRVPHHHHRDLALSFVDRWQEQFPEIDARTAAVALQTAALALRNFRDSQSVEVVWTGPGSEDLSFRRTEQAILHVLDAAVSRITLVSFAVYRIPNVAASLVRAAKRGVRLTVIVETPDRVTTSNEYDTLRALGTEVAGCSAVYFWPREKREVSDNGKPGLLHVKCAVADGEAMFLSSANLTQQAFTINMELGMLIRGGSMPTQVERHFAQLIEKGQLEQL
jgi:phosphatidylserine/phosphatidylglycerophosphate/cardiolipin synthase-like enzyme